MKSKSPNPPPASPKKKKSRSHRRFSSMEKVQAILSVWTERRKPSHVCQELNITWQQLNSWQDKALAAMIEALEPPAPAADTKPPALSDRLRKLLDKQPRKAPAKAASLSPDLTGSLSKRLSQLLPATEDSKSAD